VTDVGNDGIRARGSKNAWIAANDVRFAGDDGIHIDASYSMGDQEDTPIIKIVGNDTNNNGDNGIFATNGKGNNTQLLIDSNTSTDNVGDGIEILADGFRFSETLEEFNGGLNSVVLNNIVMDNQEHGDVEVSNNLFEGNDIGAYFESGLIDLTGEGNEFIENRVGMKFSPAEVGYYEEESSLFAPMALVDNTIGAQTFTGTEDQYIELANGAFFEPGTPTLLDGTDSTYDGLGPQEFYTEEQIAFLESKIFHFVDDSSLGLFFFPGFVDINQEDIFQTYDPNAAGLGGLQVTILGLPTIPGGAPVALNNISAAGLNNIAPAAGGPVDPTSPEALNAIETAAGGDDGQSQAGNNASSSCFSGNAIGAAQGGEVVSISYGGSAEDLLNVEDSCQVSSLIAN
jgi:hypothetical protein